MNGQLAHFMTAAHRLYPLFAPLLVLTRQQNPQRNRVGGQMAVVQSCLHFPLIFLALKVASCQILPINSGLDWGSWAELAWGGGTVLSIYPSRIPPGDFLINPGSSKAQCIGQMFLHFFLWKSPSPGRWLLTSAFAFRG